MKKITEKGFTLIELLVTIALMLSILGIAIVSFINISNNKKKESWEDVKSQIETAAIEYFTANEYLFEGLVDGAFGNISVGKLVSEDYLSKVTDPTTGKSVDECMEIKVEKQGNKYNAAYTGNSIERKDGTCINKYLVEISEPGAPSGIIAYKKEDNTPAFLMDNWFNIDSLDGQNKPLKVCIIPNTNSNGAITIAKIGDFEVTNAVGEYCATIDKDGRYSNVVISLENTAGKKWQVYEDINKDTQEPVIKYENMFKYNKRKSEYEYILPDITYKEEKVPVYDVAKLETGSFIQIDAVDSVSGISEVLRDKDEIYKSNVGSKYYFDSKNGERMDLFVAIDNAGNEAKTTGKYVVSSKPSCPSFITESSTGNGDDSSIFSSGINVFAKLNNKEDKLHVMLWKNDSIQNGGADVSIKSKTGFLEYYDAEGRYQYKGHVENKYGLLSDECVSDVYTIDKTPPACPFMQYYFYKNSENSYSDLSGRCINSSNNNSYNITNSNVVGAFEPLNCEKNTKIAIEIHPSNDTVEMDWYTNNGDYNQSKNNYTFWSTNPYSNPLVKTITSSNVNNGNRNGYVIVRDAAGNEQTCHTPVFAINNESTSTTNTKKEDKTVKAYKWEYDSRNCSGKEEIKFSSNAPECNTGKTNCNRKGPYRKYKFKELECKCTYNNGKYTYSSYKDITKTTHNEQFSYIFYTNNDEGKKACEVSGTSGNVKVFQVCQHGEIGVMKGTENKLFKFHGVVWNRKSNTDNTNNWSGSGWYNNIYTTKKSLDKIANEKEACNWACGKVAQ